MKRAAVVRKAEERKPLFQPTTETAALYTEERAQNGVATPLNHTTNMGFQKEAYLLFGLCQNCPPGRLALLP